MANDWAIAGLIFLVTRLIAVSSAYVGVTALIAREPERNKGWVAELALMWDSAWYAGIALEGYKYDPAAAGGTNVAFAPLYPFLASASSSALRFLTGGWDWGHPTYGSFIAGALFVSNASFYLALVLLIRHVTARMGRRGAVLVALGVASFPTAVFFSAIYTESLFLALVLGSFLCARSDIKGKWFCAGLLGALAALTKFAGVLLLPVLFIEYMSQCGWHWKKIRADLVSVLLVPAGLAVYATFLWWRFGSPFVLNESMDKGWNHHASFFLNTYWESAANLWMSITHQFAPGQDPVLYYGSGSRLYLVLDLLLPAILVAGAFVARRKLLHSEWAWLALGIIYPLSTNITFSMARYVLPLWPGLLWLGIARGRVRWLAFAWITASLVLLAWCSWTYGSARWIG